MLPVTLLPVLNTGSGGSGQIDVFSGLLVLLLLACGIWMTLRLRLWHCRLLPAFFSKVFRPERGGPRRGISPFRALTTSLAATVGTGNIAGVATAISLGGPGAVFWLWVSGLFGMALKYSEVVLGVYFRRRRGAEYYGGPMFYLNQTGIPWLAVTYALIGSVSAFGIGNLVQSNTVASVSQAAFGITPTVMGVFMAVTVGLVLMGGARRVTGFTEKLVPLMAALYVAAALVILIKYAPVIPGVFHAILEAAFRGRAAVGGFAGAGVRQAIGFGVARGVFSNEAGMGSAAIAHALAETDNPVRQGMWGVLEVLVDTHCICTLTALVVLVTGEWSGCNRGAAMTAAAFEQGLPGIGSSVVSLGLILFAFSTLVAWAFYGERCITYLGGNRLAGIYRLTWCLLILWGAGAEMELVWHVSDILNGLLALPNLLGLIVLAPAVLHLTLTSKSRI